MVAVGAQPSQPAAPGPSPPDDNHDDYPSGHRQEPPERCGICGFKRIHVYPAEEGEAMTAVCLHCGARYHATFGWIDPQDP